MRSLIPALFLLTSSAALAAPFAIESSPGEGIPVFTATRSFEVPLYASFSADAEKAGDCQVTDGSTVEYTSSVVASVKPQAITLAAEKTTTIQSFGATELLTRSHYYEGGQQAQRSFSAGSTVELLAYRAEGACIFRAGGDVFQADCSAFTESSAQMETQWWIQARCEGATGWVKVSDIADFTSEDRAF